MRFGIGVPGTRYTREIETRGRPEADLHSREEVGHGGRQKRERRGRGRGRGATTATRRRSRGVGDGSDSGNGSEGVVAGPPSKEAGPGGAEWSFVAGTFRWLSEARRRGWRTATWCSGSCRWALGGALTLRELWLSSECCVGVNVDDGNVMGCWAKPNGQMPVDEKADATQAVVVETSRHAGGRGAVEGGSWQRRRRRRRGGASRATPDAVR